MKVSTTLHFSEAATLHLPAHSGLAVKGAAGVELVRGIYAFTTPFFAVEENGQFSGYTWQPWSRLNSFPIIEYTDPGWFVNWPDDTEVTQVAATDSLESCVAAFREIQPLPPVPGAAVLARVRRSVIVDLCLSRGRIVHTYADVTRLIADLKGRGLAEGTMLYLAGWFAPFDRLYPLYQPLEQLGGAAGFRDMLAAAKDAGAIILPHLNFWGYDPTIDPPLLNRDEVQAHYPDGSPAHWPKNCDLFPSNEVCYMRLNHPDWQNLFFRYFDALVENYGLEAVFLDQIGNVVDDPECDFEAATVELLGRIHTRFPNLLIGGEVLSEFIAGHVPLIQSTWLGDWMPTESLSPVIRLLYPASHVRFFPHLFLPAAVPCHYVATNLTWLVEQGTAKAFALYQEFNRNLGGIPTVRLAYNRSGIDEESLKVLQGTP